jgi:exodeoxyribonuclease VII small subunit
MSKKKSEQFEEALKRLQGIVEKMERGDLPLEEAVETFTEGVRLVTYCQQKLEEAENRVQTLLKDQQGNWVAAPFDPSCGNENV